MSDTRKKITFVCQPYYPEMQSTSQLFTDLLESLDSEAFAITVICGFPALKVESASEKVPRRETRNGIDIIRCGARFNYKKSLLLRAVYYLAYLLASSWRVLQSSRGSLVCAVTNPPFSPVWIWLLSTVGRFPYQIVCHDIYPEGLVAVGSLKAEGLTAKAWRSGNRKAYGGATDIVVLGRDMKNLVRDHYEVPEDRIHYIPNWSVIEPEAVPAAEDSALWKQLGFQDEFVVQYSGNMGLWHDMDTIVRAAGILNENPKVKFLLIGDGRRKQQAMDLAENLGVSNIVWLPFQPKEDLADSLACSHVSLISQRNGLNGVAVPCKLYGILAVGRPILAQAPVGCEIDLVVGEEACGVRVDPGDAETFAEAVQNLMDDRELTTRMGGNAREAYLKKYRLANAVESYSRLWKES